MENRFPVSGTDELLRPSGREREAFPPSQTQPASAADRGCLPPDDKAAKHPETDSVQPALAREKISRSRNRARSDHLKRVMHPLAVSPQSVLRPISLLRLALARSAMRRPIFAIAPPPLPGLHHRPRAPHHRSPEKQE